MWKPGNLIKQYNMKKNLISVLILLLTGLIITFFLFKPVLKEPGNYLFSLDGDAVKSYFNFSYYLKYDEGIRHDGINYPYGDHLQYINSHPLYVAILKFVDRHIVKVSDYGPAILNLSMIFSLVLALPFIFLILRKFGLPPWYSVIISLIILYMTPQFGRIQGHFEMVYAFFLPAFWYLLIRYREGRRPLLWGSLLVFAGLVGGFTSAYYVAFYSIFILAVLLVDLWRNRNKLREYLYEGLRLLLIALVPLVMVKGLVSLTDWVDDRPENPWGFFIFHSNIFSIFLPPGSHLQEALGDPRFMQFQWEGRAYVGLPSVIVAMVIVIAFIYSLFSRGRFRMSGFFPDKNLNLFLVAAFIVLLFSMCFPFKYGLAFLKDWITPIKQFRALGRFSWIFYYVFTVYTAYFVFITYRSLGEKGHKLAAFLLLFFVLGAWTIDAGLNTRKSTRNLLNPNKILNYKLAAEYREMLEDASVNTADYQAIISLPFASTCGDKLLFHEGIPAFSKAMECSYYTGLPILQSFSPRISFSQALSSIQMLADPAIEKTRLEDMNEKPLLVITTRERLKPQEKWMTDHSELLLEKKDLLFYRFDIQNYAESHREWKDSVNMLFPALKYRAGELQTDTVPDLVISKHFDDLADPHAVFRGNSSLYMKKGTSELIGTGEFKQLPDGHYDISLWIFVDPRTDNMPEVLFYTWDANGKFTERQKWNNRAEHNVWNNWVRVDNRVLLNRDQSYKLEIKGKYVSADELLLQPAGSNVYVRGEMGMVNNFPFEAGEQTD